MTDELRDLVAAFHAAITNANQLTSDDDQVDGEQKFLAKALILLHMATNDANKLIADDPIQHSDAPAIVLNCWRVWLVADQNARTHETVVRRKYVEEVLGEYLAPTLVDTIVDEFNETGVL